MNPDRWPDVERLCEQATALPIDQRAAFLDGACVGDDELRREVEGLLNLEAAAADFLEQPALRAAANTLSRAVPHLKPPDVPGYNIIRELGEGGMGVVYLAEQRVPFQRIVALKLIRPGMDSRQVLARFERERQALARMDHPNIAAVFDAGSTADGRPYFVMEFVDGLPITEYCDNRNLSIRARLSLFIQICNAVQHAHQKGVIHRDLKPSNVLVIDQDGQPVPKVIDFGTAKSADPTSGPTMLTTDGLIFGTVEYMSPEQAAFSSDIDTTTDVYSLGVLLYELLVGCTPFDRHKAETNGLEAVLRAIRDSDPPRPSSLVRRDKEFLASVMARGTEVGVLSRQLTGDLDWIVLKALEKDRHRRYSTAAALGADVQRFLESKPIEARPPSVSYRIRKFTRRYRGAVAATVGLSLTLMLSLIVITNLYWQSERNREQAERNREEAEYNRILADQGIKIANSAEKSARDRQAETQRFRVQAEQQGQAATASADSLRVAMSHLANRTTELAYNNYAATIVAADAEVLSGKLTSARERLLAIEASHRNWEWWYLFNQTDDSVFKPVSAPPNCGVRGIRPTPATQVLSYDSVSQRIVLRRCSYVETFTSSGGRNTTNLALGPSSRGSTRFADVLAVDPGSRATVIAGLASPEGPQAPDPQWSVRFSNPSTGQVVELDRFTERPDCADIARDGRHIVLGFSIPPGSPGDSSRSHAFELWQIGTGRVRRYLPRSVERDFRSFPFSCHVKFSPDGSLVVSSGTAVDVWHAASGAVYFEDRGRPGAYAQPIAFSRLGDRLAIGRSTGSIDVLQIADLGAAPLTLGDGRRDEPVDPTAGSGSVIEALTRSRTVVALAFSSDGSMLASAAGKAVTVWDLALRKGRVQGDHQADVIGVALSADGRVVYSTDVAGQVRGWPVRLSTAGVQSRLPLAPVAPIAVNEGEAVVAGAGRDGGLSVLRLADLQPIELRPGSGKPSSEPSVRGLALSHDGTRLYISDSTSSGSVRSVAVPSGRPLRDAQSPLFDDPYCQSNPQRSREFDNIAVSLDDRYVAIGRLACVIILDARTLQRVAYRRFGFNFVSSLLFRPDGVLLVATSGLWSEGRSWIQAWDQTQTDPPPTVYPRVKGESKNIRWMLTQSADGQRIGLLSYGLDVPPTLSIWDGELKREIGQLPVGDSIAVALSSDGSRAVTVSAEDPAVQLWDTLRFSHLLTLPDTDGHLGGVRFTRSGKIIAGRSSGGVTIWESRAPASR